MSRKALTRHGCLRFFFLGAAALAASVGMAGLASISGDFRDEREQRRRLPSPSTVDKFDQAAFRSDDFFLARGFVAEEA